MSEHRKYFWEGSVGVCIDTRENAKTGEPFYTFELVRCYKRPGEDAMQYSHRFTDKNTEALGKVISQALAWMGENPPQVQKIAA